MNSNNYTSEENIQILISLLKKHNIKNIIANPGTTNVSFVASVQNDEFFNVYSCVDERSTAYMACGIAAETNEPVVITCTGATASRNYIPALTEAFYRKLPIIAITAAQHLGKVGQNVAQVLDRSEQLKDIVKKSIVVNTIGSEEDRWECNLKINDVLLECKRNGGGPVHINMVTTYSNDFSCKELPETRKIDRIVYNDIFPKIEESKVAIFIGNHVLFNKDLTNKIEEFCEKYNGVVICDQTSNYNGKYKILGNIITNQAATSSLINVDLLIDLGNISGAYLTLHPKKVWRINPDGEIRDKYKKLRYIFEMNEIDFFEKYNKEEKSISNLSYYKEWRDKEIFLRNKLANIDLPFSNIWIAQNTINKVQNNSIVHLGILNTLRSWNFFNTDKNIKFFSNTGGFGIDGIMSTAIGNSLVTDKNVYCFIGDLAFFYDLNSLGNREIKNNLRILMVNNGSGTEFHNYNHRASYVSETYGLDSRFFAADGHFGNKSKNLVKHYAEDLGFKYLFAENKKEFLENIDQFVIDENDKPIVFEVFTNSEDESKALKMINNIEVGSKSIIKNVLGAENIKKIKKIIKK